MADSFTSPDPNVQAILDILTNAEGVEMSEPTPSEDGLGFTFTLTPIRKADGEGQQ